MHALFPKEHPYYGSVIGSHADIESARIADVRGVAVDGGVDAGMAANDLVDVVFGAKWEGAGPVLQILALTGVFAYGPLSATDASPDGTSGGLDQLKLQAIGVLSTLVYSGVMTLILLMVTKALVGLRVGQEEEREGLDLVLHGEQIF